MEGIGWLKNQDRTEYDINVDAFYVTLARSMNHSWWEGLYGSRLFFWYWPYLWMKEARYGARAFHVHFPPHKLRLYSPPIKEEWI